MLLTWIYFYYQRDIFVVGKLAMTVSDFSDEIVEVGAKVGEGWGGS